MRALPIAALALDDDVTRWLVDLGLRRCGDLQKLPRRSLGTRLGARAHDVMQLLDGEDRAPLEAWRPPEVPEERVELEWGAQSVEALAFVLKTLCDRLAARLHGRAMAAARLELVLTLDRALCDGADPVSTLTAVLSAPLSRAADLLAVLRVRLEQHTLAAPALVVTLRAPELARAPGRTLDLLEPEPRATRALPRLVAELAAELGAARVGVLALSDTWSPDERTRLVPYGAPPASSRSTDRLGPARHRAGSGSWRSAARRASRSGPSRPLGGRVRPRAASCTARPRSCRSRPPPSAGAASAARRRDRRRSRSAPPAGRRLEGTAGRC